MAPTIRRPLQAGLIKLDVIFWVWFLYTAACQSEAVASRVARKANDGNSVLGVEIRLMPTVVKPTLALTSRDRKEGCHHSTCSLSKMSEMLGRTYDEEMAKRDGGTKAKEDSNSLSATKLSSNRVDSVKKSDMSRDRRSLSENAPDGLRRLGRGALNKNFLRFGRGGLNKNFLRFGRGSLRQNFLRFGRSDLPRNFLRFGRNDFSGDLPSDGKRPGSDYDDQSSLTDDKTGFQNSVGSEENIVKAIQNLKSDMKEQPDLKDEQYDNENSVIPDTDTGTYSEEDGKTDSENQNSDKQTKLKRGYLNKNFLGFGRYYYPKIFSGKRGSLDRNFLRFGKRSSLQPDLKNDASHFDDDENTDIGSKVKRQINLSTLTPFDNGPNDTLHHQSKKSVLFLANSFLAKNGKNQNSNDDRQMTHGDLIRRRSLDKKVFNDLQGNFIRFGRR